MATKLELMLEAEKRGILPDDRRVLLDEVRSRGLVPGGEPAPVSLATQRANEMGGLVNPVLQNELTAGLSDEIAGAAAAVGPALRGDFSAAGHAYSERQKEESERIAQYEKEHPDAATLSTALGIFGGGAGKVAQGVKSAMTKGAQYGRAALEGTGIGAIQGFGHAAQGDKLAGTLTGAATGGATGVGATALLRGASRVVSPQSSPGVAMLREAGVTPSPGQMMGGAVNKVEEKLMSVPLLGDAIGAGRNRALGDYNRALYNKVLEPFGTKIKKGVPIGRGTIDAIGDRVSQAYDDVLPKLTAKVDAQFLTEMQNLRGLTTNMVEARAKQFETILQDQLIRKIPPSGVVTGQTLQEAKSALGKLAADFRKSPDADQRQLGDALLEGQRLLLDLAKRANPGARKALQKADTAYARFLRVQDAAARAGSKEGVITPATFRAAVRNTDKSLRKRNFARGKAMMQDFAEAGENVLGSKVPDSGTAGRVASGAGLLGGLTYLSTPAGVAAAGLGSTAALGYTPMGQRALAALLASRPQGAEAAGAGIRKLAPLLAAPSAALSGSTQGR
ncbi:MAG: hypothetical protein GEU92_19020 [Alphaproteobacteria bacterium]|nr:hypothetical protein [Alphaproteobacteria bacterium]